MTANEYGRYAALALLFVFGLALLFPSLSERLTRPLVQAGNRLSHTADAAGGRGAVFPSLLLGVATRPALGAVRRTHPWPGADGCRVAGRQHPNIAAAVGLRGGCRHVAGVGAARRRQGLYGHETVPRRRRMGSSRPWRHRAGRRHRHLLRAGHGPADAPVAGHDRISRTEAARSPASGSQIDRHERWRHAGRPSDDVRWSSNAGSGDAGSGHARSRNGHEG